LPASPARAASIVALSASRLVWLAMSLMRFTTSPIFCAASAKVCTRALVISASAAALPAMPVDWATWRPISATEELSSSAALATVCTLVEACSDAAATAVDWREVSSAVAVMLWAVACISVADEATVRSTMETSASKSWVSFSMARARASRCFCASASRAASSFALIMFSLNTSTALAMTPISSRRSVAGTSTP